MELVVDANILLAAFLKNAVTRELLLDVRLSLIAPEHLLDETLKHLISGADIRRRIGLSSIEVQNLFYILTERIKTIEKGQFKSMLTDAYQIAPHPEDVPYLALALKMNLPVWSNDKGLKMQKRVRIYSTAELLQALA